MGISPRMIEDLNKSAYYYFGFMNVMNKNNIPVIMKSGEWCEPESKTIKRKLWMFGRRLGLW